MKTNPSVSPALSHHQWLPCFPWRVMAAVLAVLGTVGCANRPSPDGKTSGVGSSPGTMVCTGKFISSPVPQDVLVGKNQGSVSIPTTVNWTTSPGCMLYDGRVTVYLVDKLSGNPAFSARKALQRQTVPANNFEALTIVVPTGNPTAAKWYKVRRRMSDGRLTDQAHTAMGDYADSGCP